MSMSSGSRVRREGTIAMSSKPYARRPFLPRPISTSMAHTLGSATDGEMSVAVGLGPLAERVSRYLRVRRDGVDSGQCTVDRDGGTGLWWRDGDRGRLPRPSRRSVLCPLCTAH